MDAYTLTSANMKHRQGRIARLSFEANWLRMNFMEMVNMECVKIFFDYDCLDSAAKHCCYLR